ncbi:hypothetical protein IKZ77_01890 [Candidatus Saccharibacteria bacterium]|nr:hypothetical protein [Candidatus Saccharibacteria bacterium]
MNNIKNKIRRLKFKLSHDFFTFENVVLVIAIVLCLFWTFQSIRAMSRSWELSERLTEERRQLELLEIEVETAEFDNEYYKSNEYQELLARKQLDKQFSGENMVVLPPNSETAKNKYKKVAVDAEKQEVTNFQKWMTYLFPKY